MSYSYIKFENQKHNSSNRATAKDIVARLIIVFSLKVSEYITGEIITLN
jgi:hypothetical protein